MQNTAKQNYPGLVAFYDTRPGNEVGLFYDAPTSTTMSNSVIKHYPQTPSHAVQLAFCRVFLFTLYTEKHRVS